MVSFPMMNLSAPKAVKNTAPTRITPKQKTQSDSVQFSGKPTDEVYIVSASRTALGSFLGGLKSVSAPELGATTIKSVLEKAGLAKDAVDQVIMGNVLSAGVGQAPARQATLKAGLPESTEALTINKVCGSGLKSVMLGANEIRLGEADVVIAGGMESMSQAPYLLNKHRDGAKMMDQTLVDSMMYDGLRDAYDAAPMGKLAEKCVQKYNFTREEQDSFAIESYDRARAAQDAGLFDEEIAPVEVPQRKGDPVVVNRDEEPAQGNNSKIPGLRPAFEKDGTVTAGNASTINDGASAVLLASREAVEKYGLTPMAKITAYAGHSQDPEYFTTAPVEAMKKALNKLSITVADVDRFEINEAFATVTMAAEKELNIPHNKVNVRGGAVALGHPLGASGNRILVTLLHTLKQEGLKRGLASLCIGGGEAVAMVVENLTDAEAKKLSGK